MGIARRMVESLVGSDTRAPKAVVERWPELATIRLRRGGLPLRVGGWALGTRTVAAITLWRTVFVAPETELDDELLLHELRHVHQFQESVLFPVRYLWESLLRGYRLNRFEADARSYAAERLCSNAASQHPGDA
ncbi:MAG: hypothetical protein ABR543_19215 [Gemmatimonadaceae bacterium]